MFPILAEDVGEIEGSVVILSVIVSHNYVDDKVNTKITSIVAHGCSRGGPFQQSTNIRCAES